MSRYKDFQGKTLDEAINEACNYYGVEREKLEVEIVSDAKTGIFGLVGSKKAVVRAARVQPPDRTLLEDSPAPTEYPAAGRAEPGESGQRRREPSRGRAGADKDRPARDAQGGKAAPESMERPAASGQTPFSDADAASSAAESSFSAADRPSGRNSGRSREQTRKPPANAGRPKEARTDKTRNHGRSDDDVEAAAPLRGRNKQDNGSRKAERGSRRNAPHAAEREGAGRADIPPKDDFSADISPESARDEFPEFVLEGCDREALFAVVSDVIRRLIEPIVGPAPCVVDLRDNRVCASVDCGEASGLLVGREGHTLAAVQYLASRIIAKSIGGSVRLRVDAGSYRERQEDRLKELALSLAERVKATRRPQSTRPLSAYQRRIVHLALEGDDAVQTHSKGEGSQRRVIIQLKRAGRGKEAVPPAPDGHGGAVLEISGMHFPGPDGPPGGPKIFPEAEALQAKPRELGEL